VEDTERGRKEVKAWIVCSDEFGALLSVNPVQNHLNSGTICRPFADMV
jgi:hypothetical protein